MRVLYAILQERSMPGETASSLAELDRYSARCGYERLYLGYTRTDMARNQLVKAFREATSDPDDLLILFDCDQLHEAEAAERLASARVPVVGEVAYRRGPPFDPLIQVKDADGRLRVPDQDVREGHGLLPVATISTGGIAIQRSVFDRLDAAGWKYPFFRYLYQDDTDEFPTEDIYFCFACRDAGIPMFADLDLKSPHLVPWWVDQAARDKWLARQEPS